MQVKNCKSCKRLFNYIAGPQLCPQCLEELEKKFQQAKAYINENKGATIQSVSEEVDVPETQVRQWIREERLVFANASLAGIVCETCGTPITTGRYCDKCKARTMNELNGIARQNTPQSTPVVKRDKESPRMRFLDTH